MVGVNTVQEQEFDAMWLVLKNEIKQFLKENNMASEILQRLDWVCQISHLTN